MAPTAPFARFCIGLELPRLQNSPAKAKREFIKVFQAFAGSNNCRRRENKVLSLATGNSSPTKTALYASRHATLASPPFARTSPSGGRYGSGGKGGGLIRCIAEGADLVGEKSPVAP